jgi:hypothetical protein
VHLVCCLHPVGSIFRGSVGFDLEDGITLFVDNQRLSFAREFCSEMTHSNSRYGVLLTGPSGVGKSGVSLVTVLACLVRGLPVEYIPLAGVWEAQSGDRQQAEYYFYLQMYRQNTDIIVATPALHPYFEELLQDRMPDTARRSHYLELMSAVEEKEVPVLGYLIDEAERLTQAAEATVNAKPWFKLDFTIWTSLSKFLRSQIIGLNEFDVASGEEKRVRYIKPLSEADVQALLVDPVSPFNTNPHLHKMLQELMRITGGMPGTLLQVTSAVNTLDSEQQVREKIDLSYRVLSGQCEDLVRQTWFDTATTSRDDKMSKLLTIRKILRGEQFRAYGTEPLLQYGVVHFVPETYRVRVASSLTSRALHAILASEWLSVARPVSQEPSYLQDDSLKTQVRARLSTVSAPALTAYNISAHVASKGTTLLAKTFPVTGPVVDVFKKLTDIKPRHEAVLWLPEDHNYVCDSILVSPILDDNSVSIAMLDPSTTSPYNEVRIEKLKSIENEVRRPLVQQLQGMGLQALNADIVVLHHEDLPRVAAGMRTDLPDACWVADMACLTRFGIKL